MAEKKGKKISKVEWGLVISIAIVIDLIQIGLDLLAQVGVILNRFIDILYGLYWGLYLQLRGQSLSNSKRWMSLLATFIGEEIPDVDALPLWTLDAIYMYTLYRAEQKMEETPMVNKIVDAADKMAQIKNRQGIATTKMRYDSDREA